ncbi:hypothetical protein [Nannocystis pusilla]|uniref:hypothetical protein n=1 Tax=Nannocystis pusilla TaxID=889268 RepID=UPI003B7BD35E
MPGDFAASYISDDNKLLVGNTFVGQNLWPVRPTPRPINHGQGSNFVIGHPVENAIDGIPTTYARMGMSQEHIPLGEDHLVAGLRWNAPAGSQRVVTRYAVTNGPNHNLSPVNIGLYGSNDWGLSWDELDVPLQRSEAPFQREEYFVDHPAPYSLYELRVNMTASGDMPGLGGFFEVAEFELIDATNANIVSDPAGLITGADEPWGNLTVVDQTVLPEGCGPVQGGPAQGGPVPELEPWDFVPKVARERFEVTQLTGAAIQEAINLAAAEPLAASRLCT